jgi:hypothetical protein
MRVTYSCPQCDKKGFNDRSTFMDHVKTHGDDAVQDVNNKLEAARQVLADEGS